MKQFSAEEMDLGAKMTFLDNEEADKFLKKYNKIIFLESRKRTQLPGIGREDLEQACRERLLAGFHSFDENKSSEKTWVVSVIKKTLNSIWNQAFQKKRVNRTLDENYEEIPIRDFSIDSIKHLGEDSLPFVETYKGPPDGRPAFGTTTFSPEEYLTVLQALQFLKTKLSEEAYGLIKKELIPDLDEYLIKNPNLKSDYEIEGLDKYEIYTLENRVNKGEKEIQLLSQIASFFVHVLGFNKEEILGRPDSVDIKII